jgi:ribonuclease HI
MGITALALSPTIHRPITNANISNKTMFWHQRTAKDIINKLLKTCNYFQSDNIQQIQQQPKKIKRQESRALRATLIRNLSSGCSWKLLNQIPNSNRKVLTTNLINITSHRLRKTFITLLCKGWYLNHQYNWKKGTQNSLCSLCHNTDETYKHILTECLKVKEALANWLAQWKIINSNIIMQISWPQLGADLIASKEVLTPINISLRGYLLILLRKLIIYHRKKQIKQLQINMEIQRISRILRRFNQLKIQQPIKENKSRINEQTNKQISNSNQIVNTNNLKNSNNTTLSPNKTPQHWNNLLPVEKADYVGYFDGSGKKSPMIAGGGFVIYHCFQEIYAEAFHLPHFTSNEGESWACAQLLLYLHKHQITKANIFGDSKIIINHLRQKKFFGEFAWADCFTHIRDTKWSENWTFHHIYREHNKRADVIANAAATSQELGDQAAKARGVKQRMNNHQVESTLQITNHWYIKKLTQDPKKKEIAFPIPSNYQSPHDNQAKWIKVGVEEDFQEKQTTKSNTTKNYTITTFFQKKQNKY